LRGGEATMARLVTNVEDLSDTYLMWRLRGHINFPSILGNIERKIEKYLDEGYNTFSSRQLESDSVDTIYQIAPAEKAAAIFNSVVLMYLKARSRCYNEKWKTWSEGDLYMYHKISS
jgi:hypothetical protein